MCRRQKVTVDVDLGLLPYDRGRVRTETATGNGVLCSVAPVPELGATPSTASVSACGSTGVAGRVALTPAAAETTMRKIAASPVKPALTRCAVNDRVVRPMRDCVSTGPRCFTTIQERRTLRSPKCDPSYSCYIFIPSADLIVEGCNHGGAGRSRAAHHSGLYRVDK